MSDKSFSNIIIMAIVAMIILVAAMSGVHKVVLGSLIEDRERVVPEFEITRAGITVHWMSTREDLQKTFEALAGPNDRRVVRGFSVCDYWPSHNLSKCDVYVLRPIYVNGDPEMETLGHELLHALTGDFHK